MTGTVVLGLALLAATPELDHLAERIAAAGTQVASGAPLAAEDVAELRQLAAAAGQPIASDLECLLASEPPASGLAEGLARLARRVDAVRHAAVAGTPGTGSGRTALARVLARREFAYVERPRRSLPDLPGWLDRLFKWIEQWLERHAMEERGRDGTGFSFGLGARALAYAVALVVLVLGASLFRRWLQDRAAAPRVRQDPGAAPAAVAASPGEEALQRAPDDWLRLAEERRAAGDAEGALRALYLALLGALHRAGVIEVRLARTNWEHARRVGARLPAAAARFRDLTRAFDLVVYGRRRLGDDGFATARSAAEHVLRVAAAPAGEVSASGGPA